MLTLPGQTLLCTSTSSVLPTNHPGQLGVVIEGEHPPGAGACTPTLLTGCTPLGGDATPLPFPHLLLLSHPELPQLREATAGIDPLLHPRQLLLPKFPLKAFFDARQREARTLSVKPNPWSYSLPPSIQGLMTEIQSLWNKIIQPGDSKHFKKWETALMV